MVQGALKSKPKTNPKSKPHRPASLAPRPGKKVIAPKKASLVRQENLKRKVTSGLIGATERSLAAKAGHLELLRGGKKERREREAAKAEGAKGKAGKAGGAGAGAGAGGK